MQLYSSRPANRLWYVKQVESPFNHAEETMDNVIHSYNMRLSISSVDNGTWKLDLQPEKYIHNSKNIPINHRMSVTDNLELNGVTVHAWLCSETLSRPTATSACSRMALCWVVMSLGHMLQYNSVFVFHLSGCSSGCGAECFNSYCLTIRPKDTI